LENVCGMNKIDFVLMSDVGVLSYK